MKGQGVNYCCGQCGYELNLNSCNRNMNSIGSKYSKSIKKGIVSFFSIDETRLTHTEELLFIPYLFVSNWSRSLFGCRIKLNCKKCGSYIGRVKRNKGRGWNGVSGEETYDIRIRALQPSHCDQPHNLYLVE